MFQVELKSRKDEDICILIKVENHSYNYICDCGEASDLSVKECQDTQAVFISHTHIDHFVNFDTILRHQIGTGRKVVICGPKGILQQVQHRIKSYQWNLIQEGAISYEIREIQELGTIKTATLNPPLWEIENESILSRSAIFEEKEFTVTYEILDHKTDSIAYLFEAKDKTKIVLTDGFRGGKWVAELKQAYDNSESNVSIEVNGKLYESGELFHMIHTEKGKKVGVILDHAASEENHQKIKERFANCDEAYIECFYKDEDQEFAEKNYHSYASMSGKIMKESSVKKAIPVHFSRKYNEEEVAEVVRQFETACNL